MFCRTITAGVTLVECGALFALGAISVGCSGAEPGGSASDGVAESAADDGNSSGADTPAAPKALSAEDRLHACSSDPRVVGGLVSQSICAGADIFFRETFGGNGRTCGSCHPAANNTTLD